MKARFVVLTGAGVSADSGLATFRGPGGMWEGVRAVELATPEAWARDPERVWRFYQWRRARLVEAEPNAAHLALAELERGLRAAGHEFTLVSQNVDDLHLRAGSSVLAMHGSLVHLRCERCAAVIHDRDSLDPARFVPCAACGHARLRPDVVWFGELPRHLEEIARATGAATHFLAAGTSGVVYPAAQFLALAREAGARSYVTGLEAPENLGARDTFVPGRAAEVLPELVRGWLADLTG